MSSGSVLGVAAVAWLAIGVTLSLVLGRRGHRGTGGAHLFGSASSGLARNSTVPVLLVPTGGPTR